MENMHLDDIDMDFATLFDPANEVNHVAINAPQAAGNEGNQVVVNAAPPNQPPPPQG